MKKILAISALVLLGFGCKLIGFTSKNTNLQNFAVENNTILYKNHPFAKLQAVTYTIDGGELIKEMNFKLLDKSQADQVEDMIFYLSQKHSDEIEVEIDIDTESFIGL